MYILTLCMTESLTSVRPTRGSVTHLWDRVTFLNHMPKNASNSFGMMSNTMLEGQCPYVKLKNLNVQYHDIFGRRVE